MVALRSPALTICEGWKLGHSLKRWQTWRAAGVACVLAWQAFAAMSAPLRITYPQPESDADSRGDYYVKVLELALSKGAPEHQLQASRVPMAKSRALLQLESNNGIDVVWAMTTREREASLTPIRIPIDRGLLGWRIFLVNKRDQGEFGKVDSLEKLRAHAAGQGHDWPDATILRANGLTVVPAPSYDGLFRMLQTGRFQYFPRGIGEIWDEARRHADLDIVVEERLALHYPACVYFFVNRNNAALATLLERGLRRAISDGSFNELFNGFHGDSIKRGNLRTRNVIELYNPLLPEGTPVNQRELWFEP